ncbi:MAG: alkaline phosphatase family protein [Mangrovibacterium sp.]|nr:alkaline phosphatase family protein [Mangrovibacterium sp.]
MKNSMERILKAGIGVLFACMLFAACQPESRYPRGIEHVVVIGIDGMSVQGLLQASTPCMDSLMQNGAYSFKVRSVLPTVSMPNWNAMLCGAGPEVTGVVDNSWNRSTDGFAPVAMSGNHVFPTIFRVICEQKPDAETGSFYEWGGFGNMLETELIDQFGTLPTALETAQKTVEYIQDQKPDFLFVQLDEVDGYGHRHGHMSPEYLEGIEKADGQVKMIVQAIKNAGMQDKTMVMVVSDHGGIFYAHGRNSYEELTTPVIYSGKGIKKGYQIKQQIYRYDVAADVAFALGLHAPQVWVGRPVKAAFAGFDEPDHLWEGVAMLPPPVFVNETQSTVYGGLYVDREADVQLKAPLGVEGVIRYTTDETMPTRESAVYTAPFSLDKSAVVMAKLFSEHGESPVVSAQYRVVDRNAGNGFRYSFYHLPGKKRMPSWKGDRPVATGICYEPGLKSDDIKALKSRYQTDLGICFEGWLQIDNEAEYTFRLWSGGGYRLFVDEELLFSRANPEGYSNSAGTIKLGKGLHPVRLEYFNQKDDDRMELYFEAKGFPLRLLPAQKLFQKKG